ncbi:hypothetical protein, partial [Vibrio cidicii]|uniref:hypothetical protein n=1 Tax=Vibrio cidicii TaxID=1763883 RepID=UPI003704690F
MSDFADARERIADLLRAETGLEVLFAAPSVWVDSLLTELAMAVGEEQIVYLGASLGQADDTSLRVGVFTDRLLVTAEARGIGDARPVVTTILHSRR